MPIFTQEDTLGRTVCIATGLVKMSANGYLIGEEDIPLRYGDGKRRFFTLFAGSKRDAETGKNEHLFLTCEVYSSNPIFEYMTFLKENDLVLVFGILTESTYISKYTGEEKTWRELRISFLLPYGNKTENVLYDSYLEMCDAVKTTYAAEEMKYMETHKKSRPKRKKRDYSSLEYDANGDPVNIRKLSRTDTSNMEMKEEPEDEDTYDF